MLSFALIGLLTAVAAAWVFLNERPASLQRPSPEAMASKESGSPDTVPLASPPAEPSPLGAAPSSAALSEGGRTPVPTEPLPRAELAPAAPTAAETQPSGQAPDQAVSAQAPSPLTPCPQSVTIVFGRGSARPITQDIGIRLAPLREWLMEHPDARLVVEGHADSIGQDQSNLLLSYRRAKAVVNWLVESGVSRKQLAIRAAGEHVPIAGLPNSAAPNRRVLLQIVNSERCRSDSTHGE